MLYNPELNNFEFKYSRSVLCSAENTKAKGVFVTQTLCSGVSTARANGGKESRFR
jgi:hypothetical protein